jgi:N-acetyl-alpha-D-glucosaminyl L-malate synthase BshA
VPRVVTTLHGTDITVVGNDPSYSEIVAFSIERADGATAVSESLRAATRSELNVRRPIEVIPNFLDCTDFCRTNAPELRRRFSREGKSKVVIHVSNFRPVKRIDAVVRIFARICQSVDARLLLVGDGPDSGVVHRVGRELGVLDRIDAVGAQEAIIPLLSAADVFLLPSSQESFGLAALEAMACEVPVVASRVGGLPEVIEDGVTGFLHASADLDGFAASAVSLLTDAALHARIAAAARQRVCEQFCADRVVPMYERYYDQVLGRRTPQVAAP